MARKKMPHLLLSRVRPEVVDFDSGQGLSVFETTGILVYSEDFKKAKTQPWIRRCRFRADTGWSESPVSRILFPAAVSRMRGDDHSSYGFRLPEISCDLPGSLGGQPSGTPLFGLAPGGVYIAFPVTRKTGALLPHRFTLTGESPGLPRIIRRRYTFCCTFLRVTATPRYGAPCPVVFGLSSGAFGPGDHLADSDQ